jgi:aspartyl-tRNA(Asn)/glutamyl-tRNA(Gln) amidotransferase subunit C
VSPDAAGGTVGGSPDEPDHPTITREQVAYVARLARLSLTDDELDRYTQQLASVLVHARDVAALDLSQVPPTAHPLPVSNVFRSDEVRPSLDREEVLAAAPAVEDRRFKVPRIVGAEP